MSSEQDEDLRLLRDSISTLLERAGGVSRAREARGCGWSSEMMTEMAEAGILGVAVPDTAGGLGLGLVAAGVVAEELGAALAPEPVVPAIALSIGMLRRLCPDDTRIAKAIGGENIPALAWQERGSSGVSQTTDCRFEGSHLSGAKAWVSGFDSSAPLLVIAGEGADSCLVAIEPNASGLSVVRQRQSDGSDMCELVFTNTPGEALAEGSEVMDALAQSIADATALAAAELVGVASKALEITLEFINTREQFDKPIGSFQAIQHRAANMYIAQEVALAGVREALSRMDSSDDGPARQSEASRAKARACTAAKLITREAVQLHGAVGYTDEFDVGLFLNRALVLSAWLGDAAFHRRKWMNARTLAEA